MKIIIRLIILINIFAVSGMSYAAGATSSTASDQTGVSVTIYNRDIGLVKDARTISLGKGVQNLRFMGVAERIIPESVHIRSVSGAEINVLEQNYEYDLLNTKKLVDKYVGKKIQLYQKNPYTEREEMVEAILLSNNGTPIYEINGEITFGHRGRVILPSVPEDLISKPTLVWMLRSNNAKAKKIEASYLTRGITWKADYVLTLNDTDTLAGLSGWVTIVDKSGASYRDANLKLVAGDVQTLQSKRLYSRDMPVMYKAEEAAPQFKEEGFFEYHIYTLERASTIKNNQTKQISLLVAENIPIKKESVFRGARFYYRSQQGRKLSSQKVFVYIKFENKKNNNLGMPLPKGIMRLYKHDSDGSLQFIGEDRIDHTPKNEEISVMVGEAFDIVGERIQTGWIKKAHDTYEASYRVTLRNHKNDDVLIRVIEPIYGDWRMLDYSEPYKKTDSGTAEFKLKVPADGETILNYTVRMRF